MAIISGTYVDADIVTDFIVEALYDATNFDADVIRQAANATVDVNNFIGRKTDFTPTELAETKNKPIVLSASQYTAYLMQRRPQERADSITEDTTLDGGEAMNRLIIWMKRNGITPPDEIKIMPIATKISIIHSEVGNVI